MNNQFRTAEMNISGGCLSSAATSTLDLSRGFAALQAGAGNPAKKCL